MAGFSIGGIGTGLQKGLQYDVQFARDVAWAIKTMNLPALKDLQVIAETNVKEIVGTATDVTESHAVSLLFAGDPFAGSRHLLQAFEAKYGKH